jgi:hypothetical protein
VETLTDRFVVLDADEADERAARHRARVEPWVAPHLERRRRGIAHPVEDFLFTYYSYKPAALLRWHPGFDSVMREPGHLAGVQGYGDVAGGWGVTTDHVVGQQRLLTSTLRLLRATASRPPHLGCFGMHEWAMLYRLAPDQVRHDAWPLRLGSDGTDAVVEGHRVACSHFDAFRFFTDDARPLNSLQPGRDDRPAFEQPACLHAGMDLYKHAFRLSPMVGSDLVADCFELAREIRVLDMRASPYDFSGLGLEPVRVETAGGKQEYAAAQLRFAERGAPLRERLVGACERLLGAVA